MSAGANNHTSAPTNSEDQFVTSILRRQCQDFRRLAILKDRYTLREGNVEITEHDTSNETLQLLGEEMHEKCRVFSLPENPEVLDLCRVPSGFASTILKENPEARVSAVTIYRKTIHRKEGGDEIVVVAQMSDSRAKVFFKDITMLANEIGIFDVTEFDRNGVPLKDIYDASRKHFDLIICNGGSLDGETEAMGRRRGQLILAMSRIKEVDSRPYRALTAVNDWKEAWEKATLPDSTMNSTAGPPGDTSPPMGEAEIEDRVELSMIGEIGQDVWRIQEEALEKALKSRKKGRTIEAPAEDSWGWNV